MEIDSLMKKIASFVFCSVLGAALFSGRLDAQNVEPVQNLNALDSVPAAAFPRGTLVANGGEILVGGRVLTEAEMSVMFPEYIYSSATGGMRMCRAGKGLIIGGSVLTGVGLVGFVVSNAALTRNTSDVYSSNFGTTDYSTLWYAYTGSAVALSAGIALLSGGIPLLCVGKGRIRRAVNAYNQNYAGNYTFNVGATPHGFGLSLEF